MRKFLNEELKKEFYAKAEAAVKELKRLPIAEAVKLAETWTNDGVNYVTNWQGSVFCRDGGRWFFEPQFMGKVAERKGMTNWSAYPFGFGTSRRLSDKAEVFILESAQKNVKYYAEMINRLEEEH